MGGGGGGRGSFRGEQRVTGGTDGLLAEYPGLNTVQCCDLGVVGGIRSHTLANRLLQDIAAVNASLAA